MVVASILPFSVRRIEVDQVMCVIGYVKHITYSCFDVNAIGLESSRPHSDSFLRLTSPLGEEAAKSSGNISHTIQCPKEIGN
ncbi:hypothetical protein FQZ97_1130190 [compost metagenome]